MGLISKAKSAPKDSSSGGGSGGVKYICNVCSLDITSTVRIRCASKLCPDYDLCVTCFSSGSSNLHHDPRSHAYHVIEPHSIPIFDEGWGADEELLLLEGAEQYGLGSFADIADHIGGFRDKDEVRDHYINTYIESSRFPLPERADPGDKRLSDAIPRDEFVSRKKRRVEERKQEIADAAAAAGGIAAQTPAKPTSSVPSCHEVAGYMPGRLEFESEYFNEAEEAVQHMQFSPDEGINPATGQFEPETDLKMVVMGIYNDRLTARTDRKRVIFNHRLLDYRKNTALEKKRTKEQRDLQQKLKPFARMMSHPDFVSVCEDLEKEHNLRQAITQLQEWRRMKISTLSLGAKYEEDKAARITAAARAGLQAGGQFDRLSNVVRLGGSKPQGNAAHALPEVAPAVVEYTTKSDLPIRLTSTANENGATPTAPSEPHQEASIPPQPPIPTVTPANWGEGDAAPDFQLLLPPEQDLCNKLRLHPKTYICIKDAVLKEAMRNDGKLKKKNVREISRIDTTRGGRVFEFLVDMGWIGNAAKS